MAKTRVLIVEDEAIISNDIQQSLIGLGYEVAGAVSSGEAAVRDAAALKPDLVLMDIMLSGKMDGIEAAEIIYSKYSIPVIYVTAYADDRIIERARVTGPFGYIIKPFEDRELHFTIQMGLYKHEMLERLRHQNEFVNTIIESLTHPFYIIDAETYTVVMSNKAADFDPLGPDSKCYVMTHGIQEPCSGPGHTCPLEEVKRTGREAVVEHVHQTHKGQRVFEIHAYPVFGEKGKVVQIIEYMLDITERRALEQQLLKSQRLESIGRMAGGVAHDFSNIMSAVLGYSEMALMELPETHPAYEKLEIIRDAGEKAAMLTRQLLAFSSRQVMELRPLDLNMTVDEMSRMLVRLIGEDVMLDIRPYKGTLSANADRSQVEQILLNLAVNARDAMPQGGTLVIQTSLASFGPGDRLPHPELKPGDYAVITVTDNGEGMTEEVKERIFEPFFTTKQEGRGTGLGLSTVYGIVMQHQGAITVESVQGKGTTFSIYLPAAEEAAEPHPKEKAVPLGTGTETILVVDDEPSIRGLVRDILTPLGYTVLEAPDADGAIKLAEVREGPLDLLLTDIVMPHMNGVQLASRVRRTKPGIKVLYMSGYWKQVDDPESELSEAALLQKPIRPAALAAKIRETLGPAAKTARQ